jgi:hypothetical protein
MADIAPRPRIATTTKIGIGLIVLLFWTFAAGDWKDKGCTMPQGYGFVLTHGGWPDDHEGCEDGNGKHPEYTSNYR